MSYEELRARLAERYGWSFSTIDDMDFDQIASAWRSGQRLRGVTIRDEADVNAMRRDWRLFYFGL